MDHRGNAIPFFEWEGFPEDRGPFTRNANSGPGDPHQISPRLSPSPCNCEHSVLFGLALRGGTQRGGDGDSQNSDDLPPRDMYAIQRSDLFFIPSYTKVDMQDALGAFVWLLWQDVAVFINHHHNDKTLPLTVPESSHSP